MVNQLANQLSISLAPEDILLDIIWHEQLLGTSNIYVHNQLLTRITYIQVLTLYCTSTIPRYGDGHVSYYNRWRLSSASLGSPTSADHPIDHSLHSGSRPGLGLLLDGVVQLLA